MKNLQGLLASPLFNIGMGLLAHSGPSLTPTQPLRGAYEGLLNAGEFQNRLMQQEQMMRYRELQEQQIRAALEQQAWERQRAAIEEGERLRRQQQEEEFLSSLSPEERMLAEIMGPEAYAKGMFERSKPAEPVSSVGKYAADLMAANPGMTMEQARAQAIFEMGQLKRAGAPNINNIMGGKPDAPLTPEDAARFGIPPEQAGNYLLDFNGNLKLKPIPAGEKKVEEIRAKSEAASTAARPAVNDYHKAVEIWRADKTNPDAIARVEQERRRMAQVLAQSRNPGRAPTDADVEIALRDIPSPISAGQVVGATLGGDPFIARMRVIEQELGLGRMTDDAQIVPGAPAGTGRVLRFDANGNRIE